LIKIRYFSDPPPSPGQPRRSKSLFFNETLIRIRYFSDPPPSPGQPRRSKSLLLN